MPPALSSAQPFPRAAQLMSELNRNRLGEPAAGPTPGGKPRHRPHRDSGKRRRGGAAPLCAAPLCAAPLCAGKSGASDTAGGKRTGTRSAPTATPCPCRAPLPEPAWRRRPGCPVNRRVPAPRSAPGAGPLGADGVGARTKGVELAQAGRGRDTAPRQQVWVPAVPSPHTVPGSGTEGDTGDETGACSRETRRPPERPIGRPRAQQPRGLHGSPRIDAGSPS